MAADVGYTDTMRLNGLLAWVEREDLSSNTEGHLSASSRFLMFSETGIIWPWIGSSLEHDPVVCPEGERREERS